MTRKDYIVLAAALRGAKPLTSSIHAENAWADCCIAIANALQRDNARFDRRRFVAACSNQVAHSKKG